MCYHQNSYQKLGSVGVDGQVNTYLNRKTLGHDLCKLEET